MTGLGIIDRRPGQRCALLCGTALAGVMALMAPTAMAQDATWTGGAAPNTNYNNGGNWLAGAPATGIATFGAAGGANTTVTLNAGTSVDTFNVQDDKTYTFVQNDGGVFVFGATAGGSGLAIATGSSATFEISNSSILRFQQNATAGAAVILSGGQVLFQDGAKAGTSRITATGGAVTFRDNSSAESTGIFARIGTIVSFEGASQGANASITLAETASLHISAHDAGTITLSALTSTATGTTVDLGANTLAVGHLNSGMTFAGTISGVGGSLTKTGSAHLTLTGANSYTGLTSIGAGRINVQNSLALGTSGVTVFPGGALEVQGNGLTVNNVLALNGSGMSNGGALRNISGDNGYSGLIVLGLGARINSDSGTLSITGAIGGAGQTLTVGGAGTVVFDGGLNTGPGALIKDGSGRLALNSVNTFTGPVTVNGGDLQLSFTGGPVNSAIGDTSAVSLNAGQLLVAENETIGSLDGDAGTYVWLYNGNTLGVGGDNTSTTYSGVILNAGIGGGKLVKTGTGVLTLTGNNLYTGGTTLAQGGLAAGSNTALGSGNVTVSGNASLSNANNVSVALANNIGILNPGQTLTLTSGVGAGAGGDLRLDGQISGPGGVAINNASLSSVALFGNNIYAGGTTLNGGRVSVGNNNAFGFGNVTVNALATLFTGAPGLTIGNNFSLLGTGLNVANDHDLTLTGTLSGVGGFAKSANGAGRLTLTGTNTYQGTTTIGRGVLEVRNGSAIPDASAVIIGASGQLELSDPEIIGSLEGSGAIVLNGQALTTTNNSAKTYSGIISGTGSSGFTKNGTGTLILDGSNSVGNQFLGTAIVGQGTLRIDGAFGDTVGNTAGITVAGNATLGGTGTIHGDVTVQSGGTLSPGASPGTLTIAGDLTLDTGSTSKFELGTPNVIANASNDLVKVGGNLTLGGNLEATVASAGYYRLFEYGTLTPGSTFDTETVTSSNFTVANHTVGLDVPGQVYLIALGAGQTIQFWDGGNATPNFVDGGSGTWDGAAFNWTDVNGAVNVPWMQSVGVFGGSAGTVTVAGTQNFDTLQFVTDGYHLAGGSLAFNPASGSAGTIAVDGGVTAFVDSVLTDGTTATDFIKAGNGTLILTGANTYTGTTSIQGGTLQLGDGGNAGSIGGGAVFNDGMLAFDRSDGFIFANNITGTGGLKQAGTGTVTLMGNNDYSGDTVVNAGTLTAGANTAFSANSVAVVNVGGMLDIADGVETDIKGLLDGSSGGGVVNIGTLDDTTVLSIGANGPGTSDFSGQITGAGSLELDQGALTLRGASDIGGDLFISPDAALTLLGPNASFTAAGGQGVGGGGSLDMFAGAKLTTDNLLVGGAMLVDGKDTNAKVSQLTFVGIMPTAATLTIQNGGVVDSLFGAVIENPLVAASAVVTGQGSTWNVSTFLGVGNMLGGGTGKLTVAAGGVVNVGDTTVIAAETASTGLDPSMVMVTGAGSKLTTKTLIVGLPPCACGPLPGQLIVADGGSVVASEPVMIDQGSLLAIGDGNLSGSLVAPSIANDGLIHANFTDTATLDADIAGTGTLAKQGSGTLVLNGASTYTGATTVDAGKLVVGDSSHPGASLASTVTLKSGAALGGIGTVGALVAENGAVVAPGNSIGTLNVAGDVSLAAGSTYEVEIAGNGTSDRIAATGKATLGGGKVGVTALDPRTSYQDGQTYTILTAAGGVTGGFDPSVLSRSAFLDATLAQSANAVDLKIALKGTGFVKVADTYNQKQTAGALDTLQQSGTPLELYNKLLVLSADEALAAFDGLSGEINASTVTGMLEDSRFVREAMNDRLRSAFETVGTEPLLLLGYGEDAKDMTTGAVAAERYGAWGSVFGSWGHFGSDGNAARLSRSVGGFVTGVDGLVTDEVRLGFLAGYSHSSLKVDDRRSSASTDNYHLGIYGGTQWDALSLRSGLAYTWSQIDSSRQVIFPGFTDSLTGDHRAGTTQVFGELGYGMKAGNLAFEPFANLAYVNVHTNGFTEQGGISALSVYGGSNDITFTTLGLRASTDFDIGSAKATARGTIGWRHAYGDVTPTISQAFTGSNAFSIAGAPIARDAAVLEAGLDFAIAPAATLGVSYHGQVGSRASDHGVRADLSVKF
ncbi:autotransporter domain-containing protein [Mesorhizobium sp. NPDC059054]|uniref:autotransporter domain-containing protein n=1 Tax=Mesorhizobium sp. NPDC059054 TaxID=3346711 RepID=UPI00368A227B